jgi:hypothetical protein
MNRGRGVLRLLMRKNPISVLFCEENRTEQKRATKQNSKQFKDFL